MTYMLNGVFLIATIVFISGRPAVAGGYEELVVFLVAAVFGVLSVARGLSITNRMLTIPSDTPADAHCVHLGTVGVGP